MRKEKIILMGGLFLVILLGWVISKEKSQPKEKRIEPVKGQVFPKEARWWKQVAKGIVQCQLCPRNCVLAEGQWGFCRARKNIDGKLYSMGYANPCAVHIDPIEKKPFSHFYPGTDAFSIACAGCNLRCIFCQNWSISQVKPTETYNFQLAPEEIVNLAKKNKSKSIAYTYTEPTNFYEYMLDCCRLAKKVGIKNVYHSNGYINEKPLRELCKYLDAACIDLKGFTEEYYEEMCGATLQPVLNTLKILKEEGIWLEIVNLIEPTKNDDPKTIEKMCRWLKKNLGPEVPISFSRFRPEHHLKNLPPTPVKTLEKAREIALKCGLHYAYVGNVGGHPGEDTYCPKCGEKLIDRYGYQILQYNIDVDTSTGVGKCKFCGTKIAGVW